MADESVPEGWLRKESSSRPGYFYYYNTVTKESQWERPTSPALAEKKPTVRASHVLVKHTESRRPASWREDPITRSKAEAIERLEALRKRIVDGEAFAEVARVESDCSSAERGGDLGFFERGRMMPAFEDSAFALKVGEMSGMVDTDSGVHIILRTN